MPVEAARSVPTRTTEIPKAAPQISKETAHRVQQVLSHTAFFEDRTHQDKDRNGDQHLVGDQAKDPLP